MSFKEVILCIFMVQILIVQNCSSYNKTYSNTWTLEGNLSYRDVEVISESLGFKLINQLQTGLFVLRHRNVSVESRKRAFFYTKKLRSKQRVDYVEQEEWIELDLRTFATIPPTDPYWDKMWYLNDNKPNISMGFLQAWAWNYTGAGVSVAIVDNGVDYNHADLTDRIDLNSSYDYVDDDDYPFPEIFARHGTACAGIALASSNKNCIIGVAYNANLIAERILKGDHLTIAAHISEAFLNEAVHISSNSWGTARKFDGPSRQVQQSLRHGVSKNRKGKGVIYIFASGNWGSKSDCNIDGYVNSIYTIGVNAVSKDNDAPSYISPCSAVMVSAYSGNENSVGVCTTLPGNRCTDGFAGTSAATPMVAGAVALLLEANPNLHWRDVQELLIRTSKSDVLPSKDFRTNAVGRRVSDLFGYGLIDVPALITMGKNWKNLDKQRTCSSDFILAKRGGGEMFQSIITTDGCIGTNSGVNSLEHVQAVVVFDYTSRPDIEIKLQSPSGFVSTLFNDVHLDSNITSGQNWTYMSVQHWGEDPAGSWVLKLSMKTNMSSRATFVGWKLILSGTGNESINNEHDNTTNRISTNYSGSKPYTAIIITVVVVFVVVVFVVVVLLCILYTKCTGNICRHDEPAASPEEPPLNSNPDLN